MNQHIISKTEAESMISRFKDNQTDILNGSFEGQDIFPPSESFNREAIELLINSYEKYSGFRIHLGMNENKRVCLIIFTMDEDGNDLDYLVLEKGQLPPGY